MTDIGRRAVACPAWEWQAGMLVRVGPRAWRLLEWNGGWVAHARGEYQENLGDPRKWGEDVLPDFDDAATMGCLLELVREAWDDPYIHVESLYKWRSWEAWRLGQCLVAGCATEAEALVAALEAAP